MSHLTWQEFMDILTQKGSDIGIVSKIKESYEDVLKFQLCYDQNK